MDYYLNTENSYNRLVEEYKKHDQLVIAFDFDNTVYDFHNKGLKFEHIIDLLQKLARLDFYLIIFTANEDEEFVINYCNKNNIPFDSINENPPFCDSKARKIYYNILLDDRAGLRETFDLLTKLIKEKS